MKEFILLLLCIVIGNNFSFAQRKIKLSLQDSFTLNCPQAYDYTVLTHGIKIQYFNNHFYALESSASTLHKFNKEGKCINHFSVANARPNYPFKPLSFQVTQNRIYFSVFNYTAIYSKNGDFINLRFLGYGSEEHALIQRLQAYPLMFVYEKEQKYIIPIKPALEGGTFYEDGTNRSYYELYKDYGLLAVCQLNELEKPYELKNQKKDIHFSFIGQRDSVYLQKEFLPHLDNWNWFVDTTQQIIYISEKATPTIKLYSLNGHSIRKFGKRGQHLRDEDTITIISAFGDSLEANQILEQKHISLSPSYEHIYFSAKYQLTFRTYRGSIHNADEKLKKLIDSTVMFSFELVKKKPLYLQVYDNKNEDKLILDIPIQHNFFRVITIENNTIWVNAGFYENKADGSYTNAEKPKIYQYKLSVSK